MAVSYYCFFSDSGATGACEACLGLKRWRSGGVRGRNLKYVFHVAVHTMAGRVSSSSVLRPASFVSTKNISPPLSSCLFILSFTPCNSCTMVSSTNNQTLFLGIILFVSVSAFSGLPTVQKNYVNVQKRVPNKQIMSPPRSTTQLNIFGNAFANDDTLGKRDNPGLKKVTVHDYMI